MEDPEKALFRSIVERANAPKSTSEFLLHGPAIGEEGLIPCIVESNTKPGECTVKIADGHRTGETITVSDRQVFALSKEFINDASQRLFRE